MSSVKTVFRQFCVSKKKEVWDALIYHAKYAKNIEKVYDMTTVLQRVQQECLMVSFKIFKSNQEQISLILN